MVAHRQRWADRENFRGIPRGYNQGQEFERSVAVLRGAQATLGALSLSAPDCLPRLRFGGSQNCSSASVDCTDLCAQTIQPLSFV